MSEFSIQRFVRMPFYVDAVQVTSANMEDVAKWCGGDIRTSGKPDRDVQNALEGGPGTTPERYVKVRVQTPRNDRQSQAFVGDWVLYAGTGYKVYTDRAFKKSFESVDDERPLHTARSAVSGQFVSQSYAEENPNTTVVESHRDASS